jgi:PAS domain S-box-containing protein
MSINLSADTLVHPGFQELVWDLPPERLLVEVTEHSVVDDYTELLSVRDLLRRRGIGLAIDDAGAGFASMKHIIRLVPDVIKLDIFLARDVDVDPVKRAMTASLVAFASDIEARLVAEGIETASELETLLELGISFGQGFLLGRPAAITEIAFNVDSQEQVVESRQARVGTAFRRRDLADPVGALGAGERLRAVVELSPQAIMVLEDDGHVTAWNPAAEQLFGWTRQEAIGSMVQDLVVPERYKQELVDWLATNTERDTPGAVLEGPGRHRDGSEVTVEFSISPGWRRAGRTSYIVWARAPKSQAVDRRV